MTYSVQASRGLKKLVGSRFCAWAILVALCAPRPAAAATVSISTFMGTGADNTVAEESDNEFGLGADSEGNNGGQLSTYYTGTAFDYANYYRNEWIALRFDLSSIPDKSLIKDVSLNMFSFKDNLPYPLVYYGVAPGATDASSGFTTENWGEGAEFEDLPGLDFDGNAVTRGNIPASTTYLGTVGVDEITVEGAVVSFLSPALDAFLQGHNSANAAMFLVAVDPNYLDFQRVQFIARQGSASQNGVVDGDPGDFAPYLKFILVPEPASWLLLGMGGWLGMMSRKR